MHRSARVGIGIAVGALLLHCGGRTGLDEPAAVGGVPDAGSPADAPSDVAFVEASACTPAPPGGVAIGSFPETVISMGLAVAGADVYAGTAAIGAASPLYTGAIARVPAGGGATQALSAPSFNFGSLASDGARLYYPQSSGAPTGPNGAIYTMVGLASIGLATGAVHPIATMAAPWSTSSNLNATMIAATPASPGVYWIGGSSGSVGASTLSAWAPQSDTVTTVATGQDLSGLAVDASGVYWADVGGSQGITVYTAPLGGGPPSALAKVPGGTHGVLLGVSSTDVVFVSDYATGAIETVSKSGGPVKPLVKASSAWVNDFAWVDDLYLYWTEDRAPSTLNRIPVAGGAANVVPTQGQLQSLAFDACNLYIGTLGPAQVFVRPK
jgi:hypothetical protein